MFCSNCGCEVPEDAKVCSNCGVCILPIPDEDKSFKENEGQAIYCSDALRTMDKKSKPLSTLAFFAMQIILLIPIINIILLFIWSFRKDTNANRKAYARSLLIWSIFACVALLFIILTLFFMGVPLSTDEFIKFIKEFINSIPE